MDTRLSPITLSYSGRSNITVRLIGIGSERIITPNANGSFFIVDDGVTLVLDENITLKGSLYNNNASLVKVNEGAALVMEAGSKITGNASSTNGGGVYVDTNGIFTMNGGQISGNRISNYGEGGGVNVQRNATFTMYNGEIFGNYCHDAGGSCGGGVYLYDGTFNMHGGKISNNTLANSHGGGAGVYVTGGGTFTMYDGEITRNIFSLLNNSSTYDGGGGIFVSSYEGVRSTFRIVNGTIYGNYFNQDLWQLGTTYRTFAEYGTFNGENWVPNGVLNDGSNTIKVVNGNLIS
jgi:hypothetical protein